MEDPGLERTGPVEVVRPENPVGLEESLGWRVEKLRRRVFSSFNDAPASETERNKNIIIRHKKYSITCNKL